jgi:diacylglycerol kinase family enzyme
VIAAGGDGTVTALAEALAGGDKVLGILPLGTANLLARDLGIPLEIDDWIARLGSMEVRRIDAGEVNGRLFLHKVVIGFVPGIAAGRELIRGRGSIAAKFAFLRYFFRRLFRARRLAVEVRPADGPPRIRRVQALAVACNAYEEGFARFFSRPLLDAGILTLYILKHLGLGDLARLLVAKLLGNWHSDEALEIESVQAVTIRCSRKRLKVMIDGEVATFEAPLDFRIRPGAIKILAPAVPRQEYRHESGGDAQAAKD